MEIVIMSDLAEKWNSGNTYSLKGVFPTTRGTVELERPDRTGTYYPHADTYTGDQKNDPWYDPRTGVQWVQTPDTPYWEPVNDWYNQEDQTVDESWESFFELTGLDQDLYAEAKSYIEDTIDSEYKPYLKILPVGSKGFKGGTNRAYYNRAWDDGHYLPENPDTLGVFYGDGSLLDDTTAELAHWLDFTRAGTESSHSDRANLVSEHLDSERDIFPDGSGSFEEGPGRYGQKWYGGGKFSLYNNPWPGGDEQDVALPFKHALYPYLDADNVLGKKQFRIGDTRESEVPVPAEMWTHHVIEENYDRLLNEKINSANRSLNLLNLLGIGDLWYNNPRVVDPADTHGGEIPIFDPLSPDSYSEFMEPHDHDH